MKIQESRIRNQEKKITIVLAVFYGFFSLIFLGVLLYSVFIFTIGFHNFDLGHNLNTINIATGMEWVDSGDSGNIYTSYELIDAGSEQMFKGFMGGIVSAIIFSILLISSYILFYNAGDMNERKT